MICPYLTPISIQVEFRNRTVMIQNQSRFTHYLLTIFVNLLTFSAKMEILLREIVFKMTPQVCLN